MPGGYEAVLRIARDRDRSWLRVIRDFHDVLALQVANDGVAWLDARWLRSRTGRRFPALAPLVSWGVLVEKVWYGENGAPLLKSGRHYYEMPDRLGVGRALDHLAVPRAELVPIP